MEGFGPALEVAALLATYDGQWGICGGWALDLFVGRSSRPHADVDVAVLRADQSRIRSYLAGLGYHLSVAHDGKLRPWPEGEWLKPPLHEIWGRREHRPVPQVEVLLNETEVFAFLFRRDLTVRLPCADAFIRAPNGAPILAPEIVLLYKATGQPEPTQEHDFRQTLPHLGPTRAAWLGTELARMRPAHPWLPALAAV